MRMALTGSDKKDRWNGASPVDLGSRATGQAGTKRKMLTAVRLTLSLADEGCRGNPLGRWLGPR